MSVFCRTSYAPLQTYLSQGNRAPSEWQSQSASFCDSPGSCLLTACPRHLLSTTFNTSSKSASSSDDLNLTQLHPICDDCFKCFCQKKDRWCDIYTNPVSIWCLMTRCFLKRSVVVVSENCIALAAGLPRKWRTNCKSMWSRICAIRLESYIDSFFFLLTKKIVSIFSFFTQRNCTTILKIVFTKFQMAKTQTKVKMI